MLQMQRLKEKKRKQLTVLAFESAYGQAENYHTIIGMKIQIEHCNIHFPYIKILFKIKTGIKILIKCLTGATKAQIEAFFVAFALLASWYSFILSFEN